MQRSPKRAIFGLVSFRSGLTSPYGTVFGKQTYLDIVEANRNKFLGHRFEIHDALYQATRACIRYTTRKNNFTLEVSEWHYIEGEQIKRIVSYYNIDNENESDEILEYPE